MSNKDGISSKIKSFFAKKKLDNRFKSAGEGQRLCDDKREFPVSTQKPIYKPEPRKELSESAQRAAEAALIREYEKSSYKPKPKAVDASTTRNEMISEKNELMKAYEFRERALGKSVEVEKSTHLTEVRFCCQVLFDFDVVGTYNEIKEKISLYLESEMKENPLEASCLIIYSKCEKNDLLKSCIDILETLINNLIKSPNEAKFRKIRLSNAKIKQNIVEVEGATDFLKAIGFHDEEFPKSDNSNETESFLIMPQEPCVPEKLAEYLEKLKQAEPITPTLYRDTKVYHKSNLVNISENDLPSEFFRISLEEMKKQNELRRQQIEESGMLLTKQMRENIKIRDRRKYRYVLIRVLFPNNWVLQGTFQAISKISDIITWLKECLSVEKSFFLSVPPITKRIEDLEQSIVDANLAPSSILRVIFDDASMNHCEDKDENQFLKTELMI